MLYLVSEMSQSKPKVEYKVTYADRVYGFRNLYVYATDEQEAISSVINHLGMTPPKIYATMVLGDND